MDKDVHIHNRKSISHNKCNNAICSSMDGPESVILSEISQRKINIIWYMQNLKYNTNELIYETYVDPQTQETNIVIKGERVGGIN